MNVGAWPDADGVHFRVWAPGARRVEVVLEGSRAGERRELERDEEGYYTGEMAGGAGLRYRYLVDGKGPWPDMASRSQPEGPHGPSAVVDPAAHPWGDSGWTGLDPRQLVIYELHVGTATPAGTFDALIDRLPDIAELGATAIELMPLAEFPGRRNWGYDGVQLFAPSHDYGGPEGLRRLVDAAHRHGLGVIVDAVYNHLGPDGNYLRCFTGDYFTASHHTPWGEAFDFTRRPVRDFFIENALHWVREHHVDGLRLDATHEIWDPSREHILHEISRRVRALRPAVLIAEDDRNERKMVKGGTPFDAVWADDLHHQLQVALHGDRDGYYANYTGTPRAIAEALRDGWTYHGQLYRSRGKPRGTSSAGLPFSAFVHCLQNHDQIGNRALGDRLHHSITMEAWRAASLFLMLSPYTPLLFMGQEWAATSPFPFFTDHNPELGRMVTEGRRKEFSAFEAFRSPAARKKIPDPQSDDTFLSAKLSWEERERAPHAGCLLLYREALRLRRMLPPIERRASAWRTGTAGRTAVWYRRRTAGRDTLVILNLSGRTRVDLAQADRRARRGQEWRVSLTSAETRFGGGPSPILEGRGRWLALDGPCCVVLEAAAR